MAGKKGQKKRFWSDDEKRSICAQTTVPGVSVAQVARRCHHPAVQCRMVDLNAAFSHDLFKISIRDAVANIEKYSIKDHALGEVVPCEIYRHGSGSGLQTLQLAPIIRRYLQPHDKILRQNPRSDMGPLTRALTGMVFRCFGGACDVEIAVQTAYRTCTEPVGTAVRGGGVVGCGVAHILSGLTWAASGNPDLTEKLWYWEKFTLYGSGCLGSNGVNE